MAGAGAAIVTFFGISCMADVGGGGGLSGTGRDGVVLADVCFLGPERRGIDPLLWGAGACTPPAALPVSDPPGCGLARACSRHHHQRAEGPRRDGLLPLSCLAAS